MRASEPDTEIQPATTRHRSPTRRPITGRAAWLWVALFAGLQATLPAQEAAIDPVERVASHAGQCVVGIYCRKGGYSSFFGTGAVITPIGHVLTSTTVVPEGAEEIEVVFPGFVTRAGKIVEVNDGLETTIVKVEGEGLPCLPLARELPTVGERAFTLSNANNVVRTSGAASFSVGLVSGVYPVENLGGESLYAGLAIETTAAVNPGSDGGPILNAAGQLCAVVSLNVSPARWQGVGVPTRELLAGLECLKKGEVPVGHEPLLDAESAASGGWPLRERLVDLSSAVVGVVVTRKRPAEVLPRMPWSAYQATLADWGERSDVDRTRALVDFYDAARLLEVNQMLRRPASAASGVLISSDGLVLTSAFNVGDDVSFVDKESGEPRPIEFKGTVEELTKSRGGLTAQENGVERVRVVLADGDERDALIVARHLPLGIALLKIEGQDLPHLTIEPAAAPLLGAEVGVVGYAPRVDGGARFTLNSGIVGAPRRNRGMQCQTDALLNYANSGGPVFDDDGQFVGIATDPILPRTVMGRVFQGEELNAFAVAPNSGVGMIARADRIVEAISGLKSGTTVTQIQGPLLGVAPDPTKLFGAEVVIGAVQPNTPASEAGLKPGDRVLSLNDQQLASWKDLTEGLMAYRPGDTVRLKITRPGGVVRRLLIRGKPVGNEAELEALLKELKPGEKFEGELQVEDTKDVEVVLGERK